MMVMETPAFAATDLSDLRHLSLATLASVELLEAFRQRTVATFCGSYGLTEACGGAILATEYGADIATVASTVGRPLPGVEARLVDTAGRDVEAGEPGELLLRDDSIFSGYLNNPAASEAAVDADGWLHTGDAMVEDQNGNFRFAGRLKEMFKSGGYNVYPTEIETVIAGHSAVLGAAVVDAPHPKWSQIGVAFVVAKPGVAVTPEEVDRHCRKQLANYKVPKLITLVDEIPRLPNGKMDRLELRSRARALVGENGVAG
jgi:acyl-CoA synthetase (AMP-forming)/AMP-acid ligase II